jgi:peptidoglycan/LPS O-acetylase OafA/YrhL
MFLISTFYNESGYFDVSAHFKPLLHTWSLSIEEQFYLFWPALLFFVTQKTKIHLKVLFATLFLISFVSGLLKIQDPENLSLLFFVTPYRIFEFLFGAVLAEGDWIRKKPGFVSDVSFLLGLLFIFYAVLTFSKDTLFPSYNALYPCLGTVLILYGHRSALLSPLLNNPVAIYLGKISYSLYLMHWPLYIFYFYRVARPLETLRRVFWFL